MRKIVALVVLIVLLGGFGIEVGARAYRLRQCNHYAKVVRGMAQERDSGVSSDVMRARLKATEAAQTEPDPGIHDLMESTITGIYGHPELTPDQCAAVALDGCLTHRYDLVLGYRGSTFLVLATGLESSTADLPACRATARPPCAFRPAPRNKPGLPFK